MNLAGLSVGRMDLLIDLNVEDDVSEGGTYCHGPNLRCAAAHEPVVHGPTPTYI